MLKTLKLGTVRDGPKQYPSSSSSVSGSYGANTAFTSSVSFQMSPVNVSFSEINSSAHYPVYEAT